MFASNGYVIKKGSLIIVENIDSIYDIFTVQTVLSA